MFFLGIVKVVLLMLSVSFSFITEIKPKVLAITLKAYLISESHFIHCISVINVNICHCIRLVREI